jgi:hypothetical protein
MRRMFIVSTLNGQVVVQRRSGEGLDLGLSFPKLLRQEQYMLAYGVFWLLVPSKYWKS